MTFKNPDILSNAPYYDDFNEAKNFLRTLFKPGYAVQARELTQLQTVLQSQISRFADHIFADGSQVFGGKVFVTNTNFVRVEQFVYNISGTVSAVTSESILEANVSEIVDETVSNDDTYTSNRLTGTLDKLSVQIFRSGVSTGTIILNHYIPSFDNGVDDYPVIFFADVTGNGLTSALGIAFGGASILASVTGNGLNISLNSVNNQIWTEINTGTTAIWTEIDTAA